MFFTGGDSPRRGQNGFFPGRAYPAHPTPPVGWCPYPPGRVGKGHKVSLRPDKGMSFPPPPSPDRPSALSPYGTNPYPYPPLPSPYTDSLLHSVRVESIIRAAIVQSWTLCWNTVCQENPYIRLGAKNAIYPLPIPTGQRTIGYSWDSDRRPPPSGPCAMLPRPLPVNAGLRSRRSLPMAIPFPVHVPFWCVTEKPSPRLGGSFLGT